MKKPINKFAVVLWVLAALYLIGQLGAWYYFAHMDWQLTQLGRPRPFPALLDTPINMVLMAAVLASLGTIIEIADKVRWLLERKGPDLKL